MRDIGYEDDAARGAYLVARRRELVRQERSAARETQRRCGRVLAKWQRLAAPYLLIRSAMGVPLRAARLIASVVVWPFGGGSRCLDRLFFLLPVPRWRPRWSAQVPKP